MSHVIDRMNAVTAANWIDQKKNGPVAIKTNSQNEVLQTLMSLGLFTCSAASATTLLANGHKLAIAEIDGALTKANVQVQDRIRLKSAMDRLGILKK